MPCPLIHLATCEGSPALCADLLCSNDTKPQIPPRKMRYTTPGPLVAPGAPKACEVCDSCSCASIRPKPAPRPQKKPVIKDYNEPRSELDCVNSWTPYRWVILFSKTAPNRVLSPDWLNCAGGGACLDPALAPDHAAIYNFGIRNQTTGVIETVYVGKAVSLSSRFKTYIMTGSHMATIFRRAVEAREVLYMRYYPCTREGMMKGIMDNLEHPSAPLAHGSEEIIEYLLLQNRNYKWNSASNGQRDLSDLMTASKTDACAGPSSVSEIDAELVAAIKSEEALHAPAGSRSKRIERYYCQATTLKGRRCGNKVSKGKEYCHIKSHQDQGKRATATNNSLSDNTKP